MYNYWTRGFVNERLRLASRQSYRLVPATPSGRIRSDGVITLLNRARVGSIPPLSHIPNDLMTPQETVAHFASSGIGIRDLNRWTRRTMHVAPHFRLNRNTVRFSAAILEKWLSDNSQMNWRYA